MRTDGARRRRCLRRLGWHQCDRRDLPNLSSYMDGPIAGDQDDGGGHGGVVVRLDGMTPELATIAQSTDA